MRAPTHAAARSYAMSVLDVTAGPHYVIDSLETKVMLAAPGSNVDFHYVDVYFVLDDEAHTFSVWREADGSIYGEW